MRTIVLTLAAFLFIASSPAFADWDKVPPVDFSKVNLSDFSDDEIDLPFFLAHFNEFANAVVEKGDLRGYIDIDIWRGATAKPFNARVMESTLSLAYFYCTNRPWNIYYASPAVRDRLEASLNYYINEQSSDGRYAEYAPKQWNLPATAFSTKFTGRTLTLLKDGPPIDPDLLKRLTESDRKAIIATLTMPELYTAGKRYSNQFCNVFSGAAEYVALHPDQEITDLVNKVFPQSEKDFQSPCGYFYELNGADFGYTMYTHHSDQAVAYNYFRGTPLGELIEEEETRWVDWLSYNLVREPDGSTFVANRGIESRQRHAEYDREDSPMGEKVPLARAFASSIEEHQDWVKSERQRLAKDWLKPWPAMRENEYTPYEFLMHDLHEWTPTTEQQAAAIATLPYIARTNFTHQRYDTHSPLLCTFVRRPAYYAIFNAGSMLSEQQRYGLDLVWNPEMGTVLQSQTATNTEAFGTVPAGEQLPIEASRFKPDFLVAGSAITPDPGNHDLPPGDLIVHYPLNTSGDKSITFTDDSIDVKVNFTGAFTEQIPLLTVDGSTDVKPGLATFAYGKGKLIIEFDPSVKASMTAARTWVAGKHLRILTLSGQDSLEYRFRFSPQ